MKELSVKQIIDNCNIIHDSQKILNLYKSEKIPVDFHKERIENTYRCAICLEDVALRGGVNIKDHFYHKSTIHNLDCPYRSKNSNLTVEQIDAIKYVNTKESIEHKKMKSFLVKYGTLDNAFNTPKEEIVQKNISSLEKSKWRRPDVFVTYNDTINIAFEVQLQTILIRHIQGRKSFYTNNDAFIMWIFKDDDIQKYKYSQGDIFYNNNMNGFFINSDVLAMAKKENCLMIGCKYIKTRLNGLDIKYSYAIEIIKFNQLTFDKESRKVFYYDVEKERDFILNEQKKMIFIQNRFKTAKSKAEYIYSQKSKINFFINYKKGRYSITKSKNDEEKEYIKGFKNSLEAKLYIYENFFKE